MIVFAALFLLDGALSLSRVSNPGTGGVMLAFIAVNVILQAVFLFFEPKMKQRMPTYGALAVMALVAFVIHVLRNG